jgi:hypothetical protein
VINRRAMMPGTMQILPMTIMVSQSIAEDDLL